MVFSSPFFLFFFLPLVLGGYYLLPWNFKNLFLLVASYCFYAYGSFEFFYLLVSLCVIDYLVSHYFKSSLKRLLLIFTVGLNLGALIYFKYANFFVAEFSKFLGLDLNFASVVLPLGISFFTFQKISYLVDVYRGKQKPAKSFVDYALYIAFFPQLIAGPIIRFDQIAPQLKRREHSYEKFYEGVWLFVLGLSMKVLIADPLGALHVESVGQGSATTLIVGILAYSFQIYFDFAGYSKMAIGLGKFFGFDFPENFNRPYLSRSISEFWRRWHMTLTGFLKEYVYFPLGGNRRGDLRTAFNLFFVFLLTGVWHGANWTFLLWGIYFGVIIILEKFLLLKFLERIPVFLARLYSFLIVLIGWVLFQAESITAAASTLRLIFSFQYQWDFSLISLTPLTLLSFVVAALLSFARFSFITANRFLNSTTMRTLLIGFLFFNCLLSVAGSTYHPFLYFRF